MPFLKNLDPLARSSHSQKKKTKKQAGLEDGIFFILVQPLYNLERITTSKTFQLSIEIAVTTKSVDEKPCGWLGAT